MWLASIAGMCVVAASAVGIGPATQFSDQALPEPIATRQVLFSIPFVVQDPEQPGQEPVEVQLSVSTDRGTTWQLYRKVQPYEERFLFRAGGEGEYWFIIRTLDRSGQLRPSTDNRPGLRVIVDTTPPSLVLEAVRGEAGQITATWKIREKNIAPDSFKIQYRTDQDRFWQAVAVDRRGIGAAEPDGQGTVTWWTPAGAARVEIRAEVEDAAGNPAVSHAQVHVPQKERIVSRLGSVNTPSSDAVATNSDAVATKQAPAVAQQATGGWRSSSAGKSTDAWKAEKIDDRALASEAFTSPPRVADDSDTKTDRLDWHSNGGQSTEEEPSDQYSNYDRYSSDRQPGGDYSSSRPVENDYSDDLYAASGYSPDTYSKNRPEEDVWAGEYTEASSGRSAQKRSKARPPEGSVAVSVNPPIRNQYVPVSGAKVGISNAVLSGTGIPSGLRPKMVKARAFELEYDVEAIGPSGLAQVELWGTTDGGRTWSSFGIDNDRQSPILVTVDEDGIYGFRVAVASGTGLGGERPQRGDKPQIWIGVDQTMPWAQITSAEQSDDEQAGELVIRWEAEDPMLADRPVSLFYSPTPGGPWLLISSDLENTGEYAWKVGPRAPYRAYLRLEVRDEAGNIGSVETLKAVSLELFRPVVRIRDVRPLSQSVQTPHEQYR